MSLLHMFGSQSRSYEVKCVCVCVCVCLVRDSMRTVVGQARLLIKERFGQFNGLVDDCELGRGERITSCMDLEGFWEMVYYQVRGQRFDVIWSSE